MQLKKKKICICIICSAIVILKLTCIEMHYSYEYKDEKKFISIRSRFWKITFLYHKAMRHVHTI